jgi:hypothetical protein
MKRTSSATPDTSAEVPSDAIGVVVQTDRVKMYTPVGGLPYAASDTTCYSVFPGEPLEPLDRREELPQYLRPSRRFIILWPGQKTKIRIEGLLGDLGSYVFENKEGKLYFRRAWRIWNKQTQGMIHTGECSIK